MKNIQQWFIPGNVRQEDEEESRRLAGGGNYIKTGEMAVLLATTKYIQRQDRNN